MTTPHVDRLSSQGHVQNSRQLQCLFVGVDFLGICIMASVAVTERPAIIEELIRGRWGWSYGADPLREMGRTSLKMEREFNLKAGFSHVHDDLPEFLREEPLPPHNTVFDVPKEEMDTFYDF